MVSLKNISIQLGDFALDDVSFEIPESKYGVLMGSSGSGKTTILEAICGLKKIRSGKIILDEIDVTNLRPGDRHLGYVPQEGVLFSTMTIKDQIAFGPIVRGWNKEDAFERANELASSLEIEHLLSRKPLGLSGGESQRVALARALASRPRVICLDEPLSALDEDTRDKACSLIKSLHEKESFTVLHITHSASEANLMGELVFRISEGKVIST
jgi:ABC-type sugar transport system ATPase subunit